MAVLADSPFWLAIVFILVWINSLVGTTNIKNWYIENTLTVIALLFLILTYNTFRFSNFSYLLISVFLCLHVYGSKHTYANNPFGYWLQNLFDSSRNHYDRLVHFGFGFLLYYPILEIILNWLDLSNKIAPVLPILIILSASALYEIIEWLVADVFFKEQGTSYLGVQGDEWDAQKDTALAFIGSILAAAYYGIVH